MSPEQAGATAALARLRGEIASDRRAMTRRSADLDEAQRRLGSAPADPAALALEAWAIHGWYTALESLNLDVFAAFLTKSIDATAAGD
jgi:hypothetical protein